nr:hypothetical protein GCM10025732_06440 [Glycomyces mayteni]
MTRPGARGATRRAGEAAGAGAQLDGGERDPLGQERGEVGEEVAPARADVHDRERVGPPEALEGPGREPRDGGGERAGLGAGREVMGGQFAPVEPAGAVEGAVHRGTPALESGHAPNSRPAVRMATRGLPDWRCRRGDAQLTRKQ